MTCYYYPRRLHHDSLGGSKRIENINFAGRWQSLGLRAIPHHKIFTHEREEGGEKKRLRELYRREGGGGLADKRGNARCSSFFFHENKMADPATIVCCLNRETLS